MQLRQKIYEALQASKRQVSFKELAELTGSNVKSVRGVLGSMYSLEGVNIKTVKRNCRVMISMKSKESFSEAINKNKSLVKIIDEIMSNSDKPLTVYELIELSGRDIVRDQVTQTISYITLQNKQPVKKTVIDNVIHYEYTDEPQEYVSFTDRKRKARGKPVNMVHLLFAGKTEQAIKHHKNTLAALT